MSLGPHRPCDWCKVIMGLKETETSEKVVQYGATNVTYHVCYSCREFPTPELIALWKKAVIDWAILNFAIVLDKVTYDPETQEGLLEYTVKYEDECYTVRQGWVA